LQDLKVELKHSPTEERAGGSGLILMQETFATSRLTLPVHIILSAGIPRGSEGNRRKKASNITCTKASAATSRADDLKVQRLTQQSPKRQLIIA